MPLKVREEKSQMILQTLYHMPLYKETKIILSYVNYQSEVITDDLLNRALLEGKHVFVPKVLGDNMEFYQITDLNDLTEGYRGIREPISGPEFLDKLSGFHSAKTDHPLMLMPGAVFDKKRHRIGYGKGFYDRYLDRLKAADTRVHTLALCYECQMLDKIPYEAHDVRPEMILTENKIYQ